MFHANRHGASSLLEYEAADYFKLDQAQVNMLCKSSSSTQQKGNSSATKSADAPHAMSSGSRPPALAEQTARRLGSPASKPSTQLARHRPRSESEQTAGHRRLVGLRVEETANVNNHENHLQAPRSKATNNRTQKAVQSKRFQQQENLIYSSTTSTNSLPSISSSPSISPSLVCPHLTLDDILNGRYISRSPHTIGLCDRCKLDPPPNIHSPLSPAFKPSSTTMQFNRVPQYNSNLIDQKLSAATTTGVETVSATRRRMGSLQRGYSDFTAAKFRGEKQAIRDDSLDFYLDPNELRRSQMSPIQRNSVEFIRKYSTEVGRVLKVYKNGQAFEKPLRICITRNEFANLTQLLDHINSRQLIPGGARFLFHLDGQLVYSVNELKHGSSYIVSGTRNFDTKASSVIKEQQKKNLNQTYHLHEQLLQRRLLDRRSSKSMSSLVHLAGTGDERAEAGVESHSVSQRIVACKPSVHSYRQPIHRTNLMRRNLDTNSTETDRVSEVKKQIRRDAGQTDERKAGKQSSNKQNNSDDREQKSRSSENLNETNQADDTGMADKRGNLSRAKSELSSSALKRKKNVTFMDSGQSASPIMRRLETNLEAKPNSDNKPSIDENNALSRNEIGIQVSDSIDGYLIDLPLPLPKRGDEKREEQRRQRGRFVPNNKSGKAPKESNRPKKIVTITERQLSLDELDQLKDLDHGDHHNELHKIKHVVIKLDSADASTSTMEPNDSTSAQEASSSKENGDQTSADSKKGEEVEEEEEEEKKPIDRSSTINIGQEGAIEQLVERTELVDDLDKEKDRWQYPGGRRSSATPEERPVSQNEPNGVVHARVTTPTPSLSTAGDNNSLSMSYDQVAQSDSGQTESTGPSAVKPKLPEKSQVPVVGKLSEGVDAPSKNFKLTWVNGFTINDLYPDNSTTVANATAIASTNLVVESKMDARNLQKEELLSPLRTADQRGQVQFKPSDRFRNWICHSRLHDELIYPAGCLIVLWCRWTNEQRYYSRHSTNVSAVALAPTRPDMVVSSEIGSSNSAIIHLWSSISLETLVTIDEPVRFRGFKIFSLNLRELRAEEKSFSLMVSSRDDRQPATLQLLAIKVALSDKKEDVQSKTTTIKASRVLQTNQTPLLVTHVPIEGCDSSGQSTKKLNSLPKTAKEGDQTKDLLLSFGRRHFQLWSPDWPRQKLLLMQAGEKSGAFVELLTRSNCLARLAPGEFLVGDSIGNITLVIIKVPQQQTPPRTSLKLGNSPKQTAGNKYNIEVINLIGQQKTFQDQQAQTEPTNSRSSTPAGSTDRPASVTSLTRISGSIFASGHSNCVVRFWKIDRSSSPAGESFQTSFNLTCRQLTCISLPPDLGFICSIVLSSFDRKKSIVEFYLISTSNAILFGSIQLLTSGEKSTANILAHSSLSVVYEGHETSITNLVADSIDQTRGSQSKTPNSSSSEGYYFTCSLDFRICKWKGKSLVWKSMLPSACVSLAVHPIGFVLAIGSADGTVYVLDKVSGLLISYFPLTPVCINCLSYSRDGSLLAAGCSNGSIFILPVQEEGLKYKKVSIFQSPFPVVSLQFSLDNRYLLTSVTHSQYQELILWDLPNFRYMRDNVKMVADKIGWFEPVCSGSEDVRAIWENINLTTTSTGGEKQKPNRLVRKRPSTIGLADQPDPQFAVNLSCHRLIQENHMESLCIASDTQGYLRLFRYPCRDIEQAFYQARVTSSRMNCCRFLAPNSKMLISSALDGSIFLWTLESE